MIQKHWRNLFLVMLGLSSAWVSANCESRLTELPLITAIRQAAEHNLLPVDRIARIQTLTREQLLNDTLLRSARFSNFRAMIAPLVRATGDWSEVQHQLSALINDLSPQMERVREVRDRAQFVFSPRLDKTLFVPQEMAKSPLHPNFKPLIVNFADEKTLMLAGYNDSGAYFVVDGEVVHVAIPSDSSWERASVFMGYRRGRFWFERVSDTQLQLWEFRGLGSQLQKVIDIPYKVGVTTPPPDAPILRQVEGNHLPVLYHETDWHLEHYSDDVKIWDQHQMLTGDWKATVMGGFEDEENVRIEKAFFFRRPGGPLRLAVTYSMYKGNSDGEYVQRLFAIDERSGKIERELLRTKPVYRNPVAQGVVHELADGEFLTINEEFDSNQARHIGLNRRLLTLRSSRYGDLAQIKTLTESYPIIGEMDGRLFVFLVARDFNDGFRMEFYEIINGKAIHLSAKAPIPVKDWQTKLFLVGQGVKTQLALMNPDRSMDFVKLFQQE